MKTLDIEEIYNTQKYINDINNFFCLHSLKNLPIDTYDNELLLKICDIINMQFKENINVSYNHIINYIIGLKYQYEYEDYQNAIKYYLLAYKDDFTDPLIKLCYIYEHCLKDYKNAIKYNKLLKRYYVVSWIYKHRLNDIINAKKYCLKCMIDNKIVHMSALRDLCNNNVEYYLILMDINSSNNKIYTEINRLKKTQEIKIFNNKINNKFMLRYGPCNICTTDNILLIPINWCFCYCCINCYIRDNLLNKCKICDIEMF